MKFEVRNGFVCVKVRLVDTGAGATERQETCFYGGAVVEMSQDEAELHAHKLEPLDDSARAWLRSKETRFPENESPNMSAQHVQSLAEQVAALLSAQGSLPLDSGFAAAKVSPK